MIEVLSGFGVNENMCWKTVPADAGMVFSRTAKLFWIVKKV